MTTHTTDIEPREWYGHPGVSLSLTLGEARSGHHSGQCDADIASLAATPNIAAQLSAMDPDAVADYLREFGAWGDNELADHEANLHRVLWLACGDIDEAARSHPAEGR